MKSKINICIAQMEVTPGNPWVNTYRMLDIITNVKENDGAKIIVFPEMCIPGYMIGDIWERESFLRECEDCGKKIMEAAEGIVVIWGNVAIDWDKKNEDGRVRKYNACFVAEDGHFVSPNKLSRRYAIKTLMPEYREFEDNRHFYSYRKLVQDDAIDFENAYEPFILKSGLKVGCMLCEDAWDTDYTISPMSYLAPKSDIIINISCSPFTAGKNGKRNRVFSEQAKLWSTPMVYVNCVGVQDNGKTVYSFDGGSCIYDKSGNMKLFSRPFESSHKTVQLDLDGKFEQHVIRNDGIEELYNAILYTTKTFMERMKIDHVVIGASGGIDSALVAAIMSEILPHYNILLVNMPSRFNSDLTKNAAKKLAENINCNYVVTPIQDSVNLTYDQIDVHKMELVNEGVNWMLKRDIPLTSFMLENVQARDRSSRILAAWAAWFGGVFTCNANKSEATVGYSTLYGDLSGFLAPIADLWKGQVYEMARWFNKNVHNVIPEESINVVPSAELSAAQDVTKGQGDPIKYPYHDKLFASWVERWDRAGAEDILQWYLNGTLEKEIGYDGNIKDMFKTGKEFVDDLQHWWGCYQGLGVAKRIQAPPVVAVSRRAFGFDHREAQIGVIYSKKYLFELRKKALEL